MDKRTQKNKNRSTNNLQFLCVLSYAKGLINKNEKYDVISNRQSL